jgi:hypothetical protein
MSWLMTGVTAEPAMTVISARGCGRARTDHEECGPDDQRTGCLSDIAHDDALAQGSVRL